MFIFANLLLAVAGILKIILKVYWIVMLVRCLISWVSPDPNNQIVLFLYRVTDPVLREIRRRIPFSMAGGFDLSPIIAFFLIIFIDTFFVQTLIDIAYRLK